MEAWNFIKAKLNDSVNVQLLYVLKSEGSSPGRAGFKMVVAEDGTFCGTIGGGIMEHKLVEKAKDLLLKKESTVILQEQYHDKEHHTNQSGMICSGSQLIAFVPLALTDMEIIEKIIDASAQSIEISPAGLKITEITSQGLQFTTTEDWVYTESTNQQPVIHIIGGGHVSLALSELMHYLGFYIKVYDDRHELNTLEQNSFAHEKIIIPEYDQLATYCTCNKKEYIVIMTVGYRTDKIAVQQLAEKSFFYLGLLGSDKKIERLLKELEEDGVAAVTLKKIHTPIGINIFSKTTKEIAVSIAAEIIREKNRELPTGRQSLA